MPEHKNIASESPPPLDGLICLEKSAFWGGKKGVGHQLKFFWMVVIYVGRVPQMSGFQKKFIWPDWEQNYTHKHTFCAIFCEKKIVKIDFLRIPRVGPLRTLYHIGTGWKRISWAFQQKKPHVNRSKTRFRRGQYVRACMCIFCQLWPILGALSQWTSTILPLLMLSKKTQQSIFYMNAPNFTAFSVIEWKSQNLEWNFPLYLGITFIFVLGRPKLGK